MSDFQEEQELELEALESIFLEDYEKLSDSPISLSICVRPFSGTKEGDSIRDLSLSIKFTFPGNYPEVGPEIEVLNTQEGEVLKDISVIDAFITTDSISRLSAEIESNLGMPMVFNLVESIKDYLVSQKENLKNSLELRTLELQNDGSMYGQMLLKQKQKEMKEREADGEDDYDDSGIRIKKTVKKVFETSTEVTKESFLEWKTKFDEEMRSKKAEEINDSMTGKEYFMSQKGEIGKEVEFGEQALQDIDFEALNIDGVEIDLDNVNEELFADEDETDLSDMSDSD